MTDDERRAILREARANIESDDWLQPTVPREDPLERWDRMQPKPEPPKPERKLDTAPEPDWSAWNAWCDSRIRQIIADERDYNAELLAHVVKDTMKQMRREHRRELAAEVAGFKVELARLECLLEEMKRYDAADRGKANILDLKVVN
jgi:hypothetical protein